MAFEMSVAPMERFRCRGTKIGWEIMVEYRQLKYEEINRHLFDSFIRHQKVRECWRKVDGKWIIKEIPFIDDWNEEDYAVLIKCLKNTLKTDGVVFGAFENHLLKGFVSVEGKKFGANLEYLDLSSIHISEDMRRHGIGRQLFAMAAEWAREKQAKKLYISAHSAVESQAFYKAMGCIEAEEYNKEHVEQEPYDCQLEYHLK